MRLLLDTHIFLWLITNDERLSKAAQEAIADRSNEIHLSVLSFWEISVKHHLGKLTLPQPPAVLVPEARIRHEIDALPLEEQDIRQLGHLPSIHRDPFDRMLVCQAIARGLTLVTEDPVLMRYQGVRFF